MSKLKILPQKDVEIFEKQIALQKKNIILFPFGLLFLFIAAYAKCDGNMPPFYFYIILIPFIIAVFYGPLKAGFLLGKTFYSIEILENNTIQLTTFGTLWRSERMITIDLTEIRIDSLPSPKLLYNKFKLNNIYLDGKRYHIFDTVLNDSGIIGMIDKKR